MQDCRDLAAEGIAARIKNAVTLAVDKPFGVGPCKRGGSPDANLVAVGESRVYLKTHDVTGSEGFLRCARHFFAGILTYFKEK